MNNNLNTNGKTYKTLKLAEKYEQGFTTLNLVSNKMVCSQCKAEMDGSKAQIIKSAMVDGKLEQNIIALTCQKCGHAHLYTALDVKGAADAIAQNEARTRWNELRAIWDERQDAASKIERKARNEANWRKAYQSRFAVVSR